MDTWAEFDRLASLSQNDVEVICPECDGQKLLSTTRLDIKLPCWLCFGVGRATSQAIAVRRVLQSPHDSEKVMHSMIYEVQLVEANRGLGGQDRDFIQIDSVIVRVSTTDADSALKVARKVIAEKYQGQWMAVKVAPYTNP